MNSLSLYAILMLFGFFAISISLSFHLYSNFQNHRQRLLVNRQYIQLQDNSDDKLNKTTTTTTTTSKSSKRKKRDLESLIVKSSTFDHHHSTTTATLEEGGNKDKGNNTIEVLSRIKLSQKQEIVTISPQSTISQALLKMASGNFLHLPIVSKLQDGTKKIHAILSINDILHYITSKNTISDVQSLLNQPTINATTPSSRQNIRIDKTNATLEKFSTGQIKRGIIKNFNQKNVMLTSIDILTHLYENLNNNDDHDDDDYNSCCEEKVDFKESLAGLGFIKNINNNIIHSIDEKSCSAIDGYNLMSKNNISAIPIITTTTTTTTRNDTSKLTKGKVVGSLSSSDLRGLTPDGVEELFNLPVLEYLNQSGPHFRFGSVICLGPWNTLNDAIKKVLDTHVHRIWIVDDKSIVIGVITITDMIRILTSGIFTN